MVALVKAKRDDEAPPRVCEREVERENETEETSIHSAIPTRTALCHSSNTKSPEKSREAVDDAGSDHSLMKRRQLAGGEGDSGRRRKKVDFFDALPDDIVVTVLCKLSASASRPSDLVAVLVTCKRLNRLGLDPLVLSRASAESLAIRAKRWSDSSHRFLERCIDAGNLEAYHILGMIRFYCLKNRRSGLSLLAQAAIGNHATALFSLAVIQFNGSGKSSRNDKDLYAGFALCTRAASLGHVDAIRVLGHCLRDGYGVRRNAAEGRRLLILANARELTAFLNTSSSSLPNGYALEPEPHPANRFLVEWFASRRGVVAEGERLRLCSNGGCGLPETRRHEFRRCSACGLVNYCSRACQAMHWKLAHSTECLPIERWLDDAADGGPE
ncbi:hypothetical protein Cni_G23215 [Canna indica]|uniref:MYND-type domain-containing protein n=1 Tax=Canna indica TaxID=4628 RepID=A0AAQ3KTY8_9LILI|nr:hypothetical protein Cni_G23215 [Canna indica]